jgi:hypothetical protein
MTYIPPNFTPAARRLITKYAELGFKGRISSKGHWIGHGPDGRTTVAVAPKLRGRGRSTTNQVAEFARLERRFNDLFDLVDGARAPSWS